MLRILSARLLQGHRTMAYPDAAPALPELFQGLPVIGSGQCGDACNECAAVCPTGAIHRNPGGGPALDMGRCLFCGDCARTCDSGGISFSREHSLASRTREGLVVTESTVREKTLALDAAARRIFGHSLKLRQVSAGGCNACEADLNVLGTLGFDLGRFGIQFVASPRHADGIVITGPVSENMVLALKKTHDAVPAPKLVIAVGACAISGGVYRGHPETRNGATDLLPVDLFIPGCPPHPVTLLDGLLRLLGRIG